MTELSFRLADFEGPLDLLLHLIAKHKLDILDIEISELLRQYLFMIENREDQDLEVQAEFLAMAARLVQIKTISLLPKHEEEAEELRTRLTGELMEYSLCRFAAAELAGRAPDAAVYVRRPMQIEADETYTLTHPAAMLLLASEVSTGRARRRRPPSEKAFSPLVKRRVVSVNSRILHLLRKLGRGQNLPFDDLFTDQEGRSELVATFLALLELMKAGRVTISDDGETVRFSRERRRENPQNA